MAQILIRNLPDEAKEALRARAQARGHSMEAEARRILLDAALPDRDAPVLAWLDHAARLREEVGGVELPLPSRREPRSAELS
ncbi:FitA-like ribbon-helix-helix domain-containing protein [Paramicrobacterium agarici]|uniref:Antitoxin FitA-like ribbon-helix-helix domain-containing protein n=1 Tax=Paramicrobacterium agarici TaxID=630514 RepID=A0A2A9DTG6_9MICO|nr:plasmid stabilization protein [Microbacterium agarici]PFG29988.1 hypothetical protein ATJ78_0908 [Microbacterium agarici]